MIVLRPRSKGVLLRKRFTRLLSLVPVIVLPIVSLFAFSRRCSGALTSPPSLLTAFFLSAFIFAGISLARIITYRVRRHRLQQKAAFVALSAAAWMFVLSASLPGASYLSLLLLWTALLAEEGWWWNVEVHSKQTPLKTRGEATPIPKESFSFATPVVSSCEAECRNDEGEDADDVVQRFVRSRGTDGEEFLHGLATVEFAPGEQTSILHLVFQPPLVAAPQLEAETEEDSAEVRIGEVRPYGARIEVKRRGDYQSAGSVRVGWEATAASDVSAEVR